MHFFDKNGNLTPSTAQHSADVKELFFWEVILHQFLNRKKWALLGKNVQAILTLLNLAQKVLFLEDLKKKVSESDWNQCVCYPNTLLYMVLDHLWAKKCHNLGRKHKFSIFQKFTFLAVLRGFGGQKFYDIIDHNQCPSSKKSAEKCILRKSNFHQILPNLIMPQLAFI